MSEQVNLNAVGRESEGKSSSRQLRREGSIPAVIYGGDKDPVRISILEKDISKASEVPGFATQILNINISGEEQNVIVKELQRHPATQRVLHADLQRVNPDTKISISVPVRFLGEDSCIGVKMHGGAISRLINDIDITCLASNLPEYLEVDISEEEFNQRRRSWKPRQNDYKSGDLWKYAQLVGPAINGAVTHPGAKSEEFCYADI